jgi:enoyl-CoA hydratase/carnithine racemase
MDFGSVLYESMDRVATITLNRPERFNAISETMPETILPQLLSMQQKMTLSMLLC